MSCTSSVQLHMPKNSSVSVTSSTLTNQNTKLLEIVCWVYIFLMCFLIQDKLLFRLYSQQQRSITSLKFLSPNFLPNFFDILPNILRNQNIWGALSTPAPTPLSAFVIALLRNCWFICYCQLCSRDREVRDRDLVKISRSRFCQNHRDLNVRARDSSRDLEGLTTWPKCFLNF